MAGERALDDGAGRRLAVEDDSREILGAGHAALLHQGAHRGPQPAAEMADQRRLAGGAQPGGAGLDRRGGSCGMRAAGVIGRGLKGKTCRKASAASSTKSRVLSKAASVSVGKPAMKIGPEGASGRTARTAAIRSRAWAGCDGASSA